MEKEETQNKENQNLKDENSELSTDKQASEETEKKEEEQLSSEDEIANLKDKVARTFAEMEIREDDLKKRKMRLLNMVDFHLRGKLLIF